MRWREAKKKKKRNWSYKCRLQVELASIPTVAKATLPLELRQSRFWRGKNETGKTVWQRSHRTEGNGMEKEENGNKIREWGG